MKDKDDTRSTLIAPKRIQTYLTLNLVLSVLMAIILAVRTELRTGRYFIIDAFLIIFYSAVLASLFAGPFGIVEHYLYRRKKGVWYKWKNRARRRGRDRTISALERRHWKSEAYRARLSLGSDAQPESRERTRLFQEASTADPVSRPALLMSIADRFERSGKREAAERCYLQIKQRFPQSPQANEAARRLSSLAKI
jgi:hypothetical protein